VLVEHVALLGAAIQTSEETAGSGEAFFQLIEGNPKDASEFSLSKLSKLKAKFVSNTTQDFKLVVSNRLFLVPRMMVCSIYMTWRLWNDLIHSKFVNISKSKLLKRRFSKTIL